MDVEDKVVMAELTKMALEQATQSIAAFARRFADEVPKELTAKQAMLAFASAIESTNRKVWTGRFAD